MVMVMTLSLGITEVNGWALLKEYYFAETEFYRHMKNLNVLTLTTSMMI